MRALLLYLGSTLALGFTCLPILTQAAPPLNERFDPAVGDWFKSLKQPGSGRGCCDISDCRVTQYRVVGGHYEVAILGKWRPVPETTVILDQPNPLGQAIVCYMLADPFDPFVNPDSGEPLPLIRCFVPAAGS